MGMLSSKLNVNAREVNAVAGKMWSCGPVAAAERRLLRLRVAV